MIEAPTATPVPAMVSLIDTAEKSIQTNMSKSCESHGCQADSGIICAELALHGPEKEHRDELDAKVKAHQSEYPLVVKISHYKSFNILHV